MNRKFVFLFAACALFVSALACGGLLPPVISLDNVRTAKGKDGKQLTSVFAPTDTVYVLADISNGQPGNYLDLRLYAVNVENEQPNAELYSNESEITQDTFGGIVDGPVIIFFPPPVNSTWAESSYKLEIWFTSKGFESSSSIQAATIEFSVK